jgi:hypothetical protein
LALGLFMLANVVVLLLGWKFTKAGKPGAV